MNQIMKLADAIVFGIREKKGRDIVLADLSNIETAPCQMFVVCSGGSPQQVDALVDAIEKTAREQCGERPAAICGRERGEWVAMDYGTIMVHVFLPAPREYYDLENLWDDARVERLSDEEQ